MTTRFVSGGELWPELTRRVKRARRVRAAVAYFGEAGDRLLPLGKGDTLVVDLSMPAVKAGVTNPFAVEKLLRRGALVYSRQHLHAKVVVTDRVALIGSANASARSSAVLEEAAILTDEAAAVRSAIAFVDSLCTEPVRPEYLNLCKKNYRPPRIVGGGKASRKSEAPRLWVVALDGELDVPDRETERYVKGEEKTRQHIKNPSASVLDSFHWAVKPAMADVLQQGHWLIARVKYKDGSVMIGPPEQFLRLDRYSRGGGKFRYVFHLERPRRGQSVSAARFRGALPAALKARFSKARTRAVKDAREADALLSMWTVAGRFRK